MTVRSLLASVALLVCVSAAVAAPVAGIYTSDDIPGGVALTGRWSEGYVANNPDGVGNGAHGGSWDGFALYTQWELAGPTLTSSTLLADNRVGGTGTVVYGRAFDISAATLTLTNQTWWSGNPADPDYVIDLDFYAQTVTVMFVGGAPLFANSLESLHGLFRDYPAYSVTGQSSGVLVNYGATLPLAGYPDWIRDGAAGGILNGAWGEVALLQLRIAPEPASLVLLGAGAALLALRRRSA